MREWQVRTIRVYTYYIIYKPEFDGVTAAFVHDDTSYILIRIYVYVYIGVHIYLNSIRVYCTVGDRVTNGRRRFSV